MSNRREVIWRVLRTSLCVAAIYGVLKFAVTAIGGVPISIRQLVPETVLEVVVVVAIALVWVTWRTIVARREDRIWREWH